MTTNTDSNSEPLSRRALLSTAAVLASAGPVVAAAAPLAALPATIPVAISAAEVPAVVALCGPSWEKEWLSDADPVSREFIELICGHRHRSPTDEYERFVNTLLARWGEHKDDAAAAEETDKELPKPDLASFEGMFDMVAETIDKLPPDRSLTIAINAMRAARGRWDKEGYATANMNALLMAHAYTGLILTALGHPDFLTQTEKEEAGHA